MKRLTGVLAAALEKVTGNLKNFYYLGCVKYLYRAARQARKTARTFIAAKAS